MGILVDAIHVFAEKAGLLNLEGHVETALSGVRFFRASKGSPRQPLVYQSGIIIVVQGRKVIHFPDHHIQYGAGDYLVLGVPMPLECEAFVDNGLPIMGLSIDVKPALLHQLVNHMQQHQRYTQSEPCSQISCAQAAKVDAPLEHTIQRLLAVLANPVETDIFGADVVKELVYRVLCGPQGKTLFGLAQHDGHYARVARALASLHANYASPITVETLADDVNMSVSAFHRAFKQVTFESPLQYLKKVRLVKAKDLITANGSRANEAAFQVGYTSASQFSREFKRHFNQSPSEVSMSA
ncbi:transcriptional regulator, AraC family [Paraglaciecola sp. T6c]|uniref:AraC family transcriptional regulator n=1 Tax=Pseudoalteromonas atlantica (strain T6c / ATCC BAA-1087) TaxID=3042615 RepID=UPI00005C711C|nr:AraC family transcriptional regulator [Paraglaciecola sp. T6c]ABG42175.1 transcriptional regulator, AraC family [Paraglaciecola sp. T6c]